MHNDIYGVHGSDHVLIGVCVSVGGGYIPWSSWQSGHVLTGVHWPRLYSFQSLCN